MGKDSSKPDGVGTYPADDHDLGSYRVAAREIEQMRVPKLSDAAEPGARLFIVNFDGTGNSMSKDAPENWTNVALLFQQINDAGLPYVKAGYVEGVGTQDSAFPRTRDLISGHTFESRIEDGYEKFTKQAKVWLGRNPDADIRVMAVGFSRGAEQAAAFTRLVHERGIQDPDGAVYTRNSAGLIVGVDYTKPPLVAPGQVAQSVGLFDPVGTGEPYRHDRRLAPSVLSGLQITAEDERRDQFRSSDVIDPGLREGGRFLNVTVGGAHSNVGGSYALNGLSQRSFNLMADFINAHVDPPPLRKAVEPQDPALNVVHRSEDHQVVYTTRGFRDGMRDRVERLAPEAACRPDPVACSDKEPVDAGLDARFPKRPVRIGPVPEAPQPEPAPQPRARGTSMPVTPLDPMHRDHADFNRIRDALAADGRWSPVQRDNIAAGLLHAHRIEAPGRAIDGVRVGNPTADGATHVFALRSPWGAQGPHFHARVDSAVASQIPAEQSFALLEQLGHQPATTQRQATPQHGVEEVARAALRIG